MKIKGCLLKLQIKRENLESELEFSVLRNKYFF